MSGDQYVVYRWRRASMSRQLWHYIEIALASDVDSDAYRHTLALSLQDADPDHEPSEGMFCDYEVQVCTPAMVPATWLESKIKEAGERVWSSQFELLRLQDILRAKRSTTHGPD